MLEWAGTCGLLGWQHQRNPTYKAKSMVSVLRKNTVCLYLHEHSLCIIGYHINCYNRPQSKQGIKGGTWVTLYKTYWGSPVKAFVSCEIWVRRELAREVSEFLAKEVKEKMASSLKSSWFKGIWAVVPLFSLMLHNSTDCQWHHYSASHSLWSFPEHHLHINTWWLGNPS